MMEKPWKTTRHQWEALRFFLIFYSWMQMSQGLENVKLPDSVGVLSNKIVAEMPEVDQFTIETSEIIFDNEKNNTRPWVPKCCNLTYGFSFENKSLCVETEDEFLPDFEDWLNYSEKAKDLPVKTRYEYYIGDPCTDGKYILDQTTYPDDKYSIFKNGTLLYLEQLYSKEEFCLETLNGTIRAFICFGAGKPIPEINFTFIIYATGLLTSIPFLLATALVYLCVDMFRDNHGKSLSCHVLCLAIGYLVLAVVQLASDQLNETLCIAAGFIIQFFFVASFFWLNVICYDTWRCIDNDFRCVLQQADLRSENILFYCYSLYGWYGPVILSIITLIMDLEPAIPESYLKPNFGLRSCWFYSDDAALPYFYGPVALVIFVNLIFFFMSARKIYLKQKREKEFRAHHRDAIRETQQSGTSVSLYFKTLHECIYLFCIMGINWVAEVISWAVGGSKTIWLVTDIFNALQGIMIFCLFVVKPKEVRNEVKRRMCITWKRIIKCDCQYHKENKRISRHWHANFRYEAEELSFGDESDKFITQQNTTAV